MKSTALTSELPARMKWVKQHVDAELAAYCREGLERAQSLDSAYGRLWQAIAAVANSGGKRLRPYLAVLVYEGMGGKDRAAFLRVATAWELLHVGLLVHDDVIDRDYVRHGTLNVSGQLREAYKAYPYAQASHDHLADGAAIMAGDLLLTSAYQWIMTSSFALEQLRGVTQIMDDAVYAVVGGELLDTEATMQPLDAVDAAKVADLKTAQYSIVGPALTGALLAGASRADYERLQEFGRTFGIAYQLQDDLLGVFGKMAKTGKPVGNDLKEGKRTMLLQYAFALANETDRSVMHAILAQPSITSEDVARLQTILTKTNAAELVRSRIAQSRDQLIAMLSETTLTKQCKKELEWFVTYALDREV